MTFARLFARRAQAVRENMALFSTLNDYIDSLSSTPKELYIEESLPSTEAYYTALERLTASKKLHPYLRRGHVKRLFRELSACGFIPECKLRFGWLTRERAYMKDTGLAAFSMHYLGMKDGAYLARLVLHEVAHLNLSAREDYAYLLRLDGEFLSHYRGKEAKALSPVEFFATHLSIALMRCAAEHIPASRNALLAECATEERKLFEYVSVFTGNA